MCDCPEGPTPVTDWARGDVVCCACGVVVEGHILDETPQWHDHAADADSRRRRGSEASARPAKRARALEDPRELALNEGLDVLKELVVAMRLSTTGTVACMARELFADLHAAKAVRSDNRRAVAAAALYYGCKLENAGRELRLVSDVCGVELKALNAATSEYKASLADRPYYPRLFATLQAGKLIDIFLDRLRLAPEVRKRVWRAAHQMDEALVDIMDCGRKPRTICSGILYLAAQQERVTGVGKKEITEACSVCQQTLDKVVAQITAQITQIQGARPGPGPSDS